MNTPLLVRTEAEPITLRQLTIEDAQAYFAAVEANREHLSQFGDGTSDKYPTLESVEESITNPTNPNRLRMGIWDKATFVGSINLTPSEDKTDAEIGYWLDERQTGKGYATIATRAISAYAKGRFSKIHAEVVEGNEASVEVLKRSGFKEVTNNAGILFFELVSSD